MTLTPAAPDHSPLTQLEAYWQSLRPHPRDLPRRGSVIPQELNSLSQHLMLCNRISATEVRIRYAGDAFYDMLGMDPRGMPMTALFLSDERAELNRILDRVFTMPARLNLQLEARLSEVKLPAKARLMVLPMRGPQGEIDRAICAISCLGALGAPPLRWGITGYEVTGLGAAASTSEPSFALAASQAEPPPNAGFSEPKLAFLPRPRPPVQYGHLRLVKG